MSTNTENQGSSMDTLKWGLVAVILAAAVVGNHYFAAESVLIRAVGVVVAIAIALFIAAQTEKGKAGWAFAQESRMEVRKVVWPTRQETVQTTLIVFAATAFMAFCLWLLDMGLVWIVNLITGV
ncbi:preprotein translocase subunit SecE [Ferrimonas balearica]|uniref:preprotein translocase subunit SecE n=1 Tax=Ferrimonas balearica TaxID=44012 RepID=UPI001C998B46|nr:preprotein translocase subunit SecE [Ferrimonas balearica]MBY5923571.1 preprotein translocase subunit SecE [Ferrimonas balearica]MBY5997334.1 preprotein translocase subunit SecE [Ferrimonas balearica]